MRPFLASQVARIPEFVTIVFRAVCGRPHPAAPPRIRPPPLNHNRFIRFNFFSDGHLGTCEESRLAEAFIICATDKDQALAMLATFDSSAARSAALRIVTNYDKAEGAANWVQRCGLKLDDFDSEGKFLHLMNELVVGQWQEALED